MKIVFFDVQDYEIGFLEKNCPKDVEAQYFQGPIEAFEGDVDVDGICVFAINPVRAEMLERFKNLKYIFTRSVGFSQIDKDYCISHGIKVFNTPHYGDYTIAEFAFGLLLSSVRKIRQSSDAIKNGNVDLGNFVGMELYSKTIGIVGLGAIGQKVAKIAEGFSMNVICYDLFEKEGYNYVSLDELCEKSDVITLHAPLTENNRHLFNDKMFEKMKDGVVLINTARGEIVDTQALLRAIENGKIAFCALDVLECETLMMNSEKCCADCQEENCLKKFFLNQKLLSHPNVLITPHVAYDTKEAIERILKITMDNISSAKDGKYENMVF